MQDLKHTTITEPLSPADKLGASILIIATVGSILLLNLLPLEWIA